MNWQALDTNILVYALLDLADKRKTALARSLFERIAKEKCGVLSTQVLNEFANVALKQRKPIVSMQELFDHLHDLQTFRVIVVDPAITSAAVTRHFESQVSFYDALVVEAAIAAGASVLYSEDLQHGQRFGSLQILNPFAS